MMNEKQEAALRLALEALKGGLWDYGPGQDEHQRCNEVIAICEEALADSALDRMAENARELGLDYEPSANVAAVNTSSERVDKTSKNVHEQPAPVAPPHEQQEPVAYVRNLTDPQPHCVTDLKYMSVADTNAGVQYTPLYTSPPASKPLTDKQIEKKFEEFAAQYDTLGDAWQDMGANDYFRAGFKAALGIKGDA